MELKRGTRLGPYEILGQLGSGGMGEVYRARDTRLDREVAVKVLPDRFASNPDFQGRFEREAKAVAALSHPNIVAIHDFGIDGGTHYSVSEMLHGSTLKERMQDTPLPPRRALDYALQIARGLAAAHDRGILHRDLKPENLFITEDGQAKILDFGLARAAAPEAETGLTGMPTLGTGTEPGTVLGTVGYMSPEQVRGQPLDARSDLFSFGAVLYEMLTGRRAFQAASAADTLTAILREDPPDLSDSGRSMPAALDRIVRHCLEKNPAQRFQSTRDLVFSLEAAGTTSGAAPVARPGTLPRESAGRWWLIPAAAGLAAGILAGLASGLGLGRGGQEASPPTVRYLSYSGFDGEPSASPDGRLIAYTSVHAGRSQIWLKQFPGGDEVALTSGPDTRPRFSPDGSLVLFVRGAGGRPALYKVPVVGGEPREVLEDAMDGDWSPDGRQIVFLRSRLEGDRAFSSVGIVDASGEGAREISRQENVTLDFPRWSPDGSTIAVSRSGTENIPNSVLLVAADGTGLRTLNPPPPAGLLSSVAWSGSGTSIVYAQMQSFVQIGVAGGSGRITRQEVRSGDSETVLWIPTVAPVIDILGSGRLLLGTSSQRQNLLEVPLAGGPDGQGDRWLTRGSSIDRQPVFSPDGEWVLFSSNRTGNLDLWKLSTRTGAVRRITEDRADDWDPAFTPDGSSIVWSSSRTGHFEIWLCAADGTRARRITDDGVDAENATVTADGRWVVYNSGNPAHPGIWKIHADGTGAERIVPGTWSTPEVSPDGEYVAFRTSTMPRTVRVARIADGALDPFPIVLPEHPTSGRPRWTPDGRSLAFTGANAEGARGIFVQTFSFGQDTRLTRRPLAGFDMNLPLETFGFSRDGRRLVYSAVDTLDSLMLAEDVRGLEPPARRSP